MKQFIIVMAFLMLGLFIGSLVNDYKEPFSNMKNNSITEINKVITTSAITKN